MGPLYLLTRGSTMREREGPSTIAIFRTPRRVPMARPAQTGQVAFYGTALYNNNQAEFNSAVQISTPLTADRSGNMYFRFHRNRIKSRRAGQRHRAGHVRGLRNAGSAPCP